MARRTSKAIKPAKREPNKQERAAMDEAKERYEARPARAVFKQKDADPGVLNLDTHHNDEVNFPYLVNDTFGTTEGDFTTECIKNLASATGSKTEVDMNAFNASMALVGAIGARDELEAALAVQMAATHQLTVEMLRRTRNADRVEIMKDYGNLATKLSRTFNNQMKTLTEWRRGGEQIVRHIHVNEGGQAVFTETLQVGGKNEQVPGQAHEPRAALLGPQSAGQPVSVASNEREEAVPVARRKSDRRSQG